MEISSETSDSIGEKCDRLVQHSGMEITEDCQIMYLVSGLSRQGFADRTDKEYERKKSQVLGCWPVHLGGWKAERDDPNKEQGELA